MSENGNTTDALPSPPRGEEKTSDKDNKNKTEFIQDDDEKEDKFNGIPRPQGAQAVLIQVSKSTNTHIGNSISIIVNGAKKNNDPIHETEKIRSLKASNDPVTNADIDILSQHICSGWEYTARKLGYSKGQIEQFEYRHPKDLKEAIYELLKDWMQDKGPSEATVGRLAQILWNTEQREAVDLWSKQYAKLSR